MDRPPPHRLSELGATLDENNKHYPTSGYWILWCDEGSPGPEELVILYQDRDRLWRVQYRLNDSDECYRVGFGAKNRLSMATSREWPAWLHPLRDVSARRLTDLEAIVRQTHREAVGEADESAACVAGADKLSEFICSR